LIHVFRQSHNALLREGLDWCWEMCCKSYSSIGSCIESIYHVLALHSKFFSEPPLIVSGLSDRQLDCTLVLLCS
jgi:hypothetical protein